MHAKCIVYDEKEREEKNYRSRVHKTEKLATNIMLTANISQFYI